MKKYVQGFSLVEVLVAAFIMFISLAVFTEIYRTALMSSEQASTNLKRHASLPLVLDKIAIVLKNEKSNSSQGSEQLLSSKFEWRANVIKSISPPDRVFGDEVIKASHRAKLWRVEIRVEGSPRVFSYEELTW